MDGIIIPRTRIRDLALSLLMIGPLGGVPQTLGTTFLPVPLEKQVKNADGVIRGKFINETSKKMVTGEVVTQASFQILEASGILPREIVNKNNFQVLYPGGTWDGIVYHISGNPQFKKNEEVVLFITKGPYGMQLVNLGLSKYVLFKEGGKTFLQNKIFPKHPLLGKIPLTTLNGLLDREFGHPLREPPLDKHVYIEPKTKKSRQHSTPGRAPASVGTNEPQTEKNSSLHVFWIVLLFSLLGVGLFLYEYEKDDE